MKRKNNLTAAQVEKTATEWKSVSPETAMRLKRKVEALASEERVKKDAIFTARLRQDDLDSFKKIAEEKRIPYQTLLGHVIHAYATGTLVDLSEVQKVLGKKLKVG
jgi:predicted DNA binding CopG/RHH family protein